MKNVVPTPKLQVGNLFSKHAMMEFEFKNFPFGNYTIWLCKIYITWNPKLYDIS